MAKLPAYAKSIVAERDLGHHPDLIWVFFGNDWSRRLPNSVCIRPADYQPGVFRFGWTGGVRINVVERDEVEADERDAVRLAIEIAKHTAPVFLCWLDAGGKNHVPIDDYLAMPGQGRPCWTKSVAKIYDVRRRAYYETRLEAMRDER